MNGESEDREGDRELDEVQQIVGAIAQGGTEESQQVGELDRDLVRQDQAQDLKLKKVIAYSALALMAVQIVAADAAFYCYGFFNDWDIPEGAIQAWLLAAVVQVVAVVLVVTRSLFPPKGK